MPVDRLAELVPSHKVTVSKWRGGQVPVDARIERLATLLGVQAKWLKTGEGERYPERAKPGQVRELPQGYEADKVHAALELMAQSLAGLTAAIRLLEGRHASGASTAYVPDEPERMVSQMNPNVPTPDAPAPRAHPKRA